MAKQYWRASVWSPSQTKVYGQYGLWNDEAGIEKYAANMLKLHPQASYACWESQVNPNLKGCTGAVPAPPPPPAPSLNIQLKRRSAGGRSTPYVPPTIAGCGCAGLGQEEPQGRAVGVVAALGIGLLAVGLIWLGTRGD